eukprot:2425346-Alexandrium_andersonii.AAC.1
MPADPVLRGDLPGARPAPIDHGQLDDGPRGLHLQPRACRSSSPATCGGGWETPLQPPWRCRG